MTLRFLALLLAGLIGASSAQAAGDPSARCVALDATRADGWNLATDLSWASVAFDPAPQARARWAAMVAQARDVRAEQTARAAASLASPGREVQLAPDCYASISCFMVLEIDALHASVDGADFPALLASARQTMFLVNPLAEHLDERVAAATDNMAVATGLSDRDQTLRAVYIAALDDDATPWLRPTARQLAVLLVRTQVRLRDISASHVADCLLTDARDPNSHALRKVLWPVVQHADRNPSFQHRMLAMYGSDPLFQKTPELALLRDRIELATTGLQIYGSQSICSNGRWRIAPVRDPGTVDLRRRDVGLKPLGDLLREEGERC